MIDPHETLVNKSPASFSLLIHDRFQAQLYSKYICTYGRRLLVWQSKLMEFAFFDPGVVVQFGWQIGNVLSVVR